jgi:hypothetical protein
MCEQASTIASDASSDFMLPFYVGALFVRNGTAEVGQVFQVRTKKLIGPRNLFRGFFSLPLLFLENCRSSLL